MCPWRSAPRPQANWERRPQWCNMAGKCYHPVPMRSTALHQAQRVATVADNLFVAVSRNARCSRSSQARRSFEMVLALRLFLIHIVTGGLDGPLDVQYVTTGNYRLPAVPRPSERCDLHTAVSLLETGCGNPPRSVAAANLGGGASICSQRAGIMKHRLRCSLQV